jgi:hypothetical protein
MLKKEKENEQQKQRKKDKKGDCVWWNDKVRERQCGKGRAVS